ncbi:MAG: hypothetical protein WAQ52_02935 [Terriglobales bacterium]
MTLTSYRRDLRARKRELADLLRQRQNIDEKIARLPPLISHLEGLCRELGDRSVKEHATKVELTSGLTELARVTLEEVHIPLSTSELKQRMETKGFDFSHYSNPLSSIHVVLQRLVKSGQVKVVPQKGGRKAYQWITLIDSLLSLLQTVGSVERSQAQGVQVKSDVGSEAATKSLSVTLKKR